VKGKWDFKRDRNLSSACAISSLTGEGSLKGNLAVAVLLLIVSLGYLTTAVSIQASGYGHANQVTTYQVTPTATTGCIGSVSLGPCCYCPCGWTCTCYDGCNATTTVTTFITTATTKTTLRYLSVNFDKSTYYAGDTVHITGGISTSDPPQQATNTTSSSSLAEGLAVAIAIYDPSGVSVLNSITNPSAAGYDQYAYDYILPATVSSGTYTVMVSYSTPGGGTPLHGRGTFQVAPTTISPVVSTVTQTSTITVSMVVTSVTTVTVEGLQMQVVSNSSVSGLVFDSTRGLLNFTVSGPTGTYGFFNATIVKTLLSGQPVVLIDGVQSPASVTQDANFWYVHVTYMHSQHHVTIGGSNTVPEFPSTLLLMVAFVLVVVIFGRRTRYLSRC
jgi:hypothetical protein